ncbi:MAG: bifunctional 5,10-methylenetetrahydrofolate dehydrogenase/5,10-methenyltetrahydrofolate cyclohydrolase [Candidatus Kaelpia aquatica]|nr:bifunctional 5,10-methylenetetrahydrofolate dehydrogenase/5,10-methenyltetrahydrofolate cyclohydrolase [Candidatus Kaelpia aquatica]
MNNIIDGKNIALVLTEGLKKEFFLLEESYGVKARMAAFCFSSDSASDIYVKAQSKLAAYLGVEYQIFKLGQDFSLANLKQKLSSLNSDSNLDGIMIMQPLADSLDCRSLLLDIDPVKDIEGIHPMNLGDLISSNPALIPPTAAAIMNILDSCVEDYVGSEVVVIGHSHIVGKPLAMLLADKLATVTLCHIGTSKVKRLKAHVERADVLIVAVGKPGLIKGEWIKEGAIVIDVGINKVGTNIVGDVEFEEAKKRASYITPVPAGVGPVTTVMLMRNLLLALKKRRNIRI